MADILVPDSRIVTELAYPSRKPAIPVKIDWSHDILQDNHLVGSWIFTNGINNLVKNSLVGNGISDAEIIKSGNLVGESPYGLTDSVLSHNSIDVTINGASIVVSLNLKSIEDQYSSVACADDISYRTTGFALSYQGSEIRTTTYGDGGYSGTRSLIMPTNKDTTVSASCSAALSTELIVDGDIATVLNDDWWRYGAGLGANNSYNSTRGQFDGYYNVYHVFDNELSIDDLMALNDDPYQFYVPV